MAEALCATARRGSAKSLESLLQVESVAQMVDEHGPTGVNALHLAVWRNHVALASALLQAGADPNARDAESSWSALHKALYWGNLRLAAELLGMDASLALPDCRGRTPLDLLSHELQAFLGPGPGDVFSWGSGSNYTLGTGSTDVELDPTRVEGLHEAHAWLLSAAKFHSAAVTQAGQLYTWGWGRGGRLGHPEAHIHSGESAVITPRVVAALGRRQVAAVAAAKHHTVLCTLAGEVFTFGSNRHGQLGHAVDTQPTPKRLATLRQRVVAVAAANKHSVAVTAGGEVFTWGGNAVGQLGYGSVDSTSNAVPRLVEAMKGRRVVAAAAAKRHTLVLTAEGEVYTWGHRGVSPRRVVLAGARDTAASGGEALRFHRGHADVARPVAAAICAGAAHSSVLTSTGVVLCWRSADPALQVQEVMGPLAGQRVVSIAAGKYRTGAVTEAGDVYMWEGRSDYFPADGRQSGSGSKKVHSSGRPIPPRAPGLGLQADASGSAGTPGGTPGSYGSLSRRGSHFERFAAEREPSWAGPSSLGVRGATPPSGRATPAKRREPGDAFARITPDRVQGLKRVVHVAVGEKHSLAVQRWGAAQLRGLPHMPWLLNDCRSARQDPGREDTSLYTCAADGEEGSQLATPRRGDLSSENSGAESALASPLRYSPARPSDSRRPARAGEVGVPSLQRSCEEAVARHLVDPRTALQVLEYADVAGASMLRSYCLSVALCNLDAVLVEARGAFEDLPQHLLAELERLWKLRLEGIEGEEEEEEDQHQQRVQGEASLGLRQAPEPAGPEGEDEGEVEAQLGVRGLAAAQQQMQATEQQAGGALLGTLLQQGRRPTAAPAALVEHDEGGGRVGVRSPSPPGLGVALAGSESSFWGQNEAQGLPAAGRLLRTLQKKLQQIASLEARAAAGALLDAQQQAKVAQRGVLHAAVQALEGGMTVAQVQSILRSGADAVAEDSAGQHAPNPCSAGKSRQASCGTKAKGAPASTAKKAAAAQQEQQQEQQAGQRSREGGEPALQLLGLPLSGSASTGATGTAEPLPSPLPGSSPPAVARLPPFGLVERAGAPATGEEAPSLGKGESVPSASQVGFTQVGFAACPDTAKARSSGKGRDGKAKRKGGLSMFLRGELDISAAKTVAASPAATGPAWGGKGTSTPPAAVSLRTILQAETSSPAPARFSGAKPGASARGGTAAVRGAVGGAAAESPHDTGAGPMRLSLASFMQSAGPVSIVQQQPKAAGPAWGGAAGASPSASGASLLDIQREQQRAAAAAVASPAPSPAVRRPAAGAVPWKAVGGDAAVGTTSVASGVVLGTSPTGSSLLGTSPTGRTASFNAAPRPQQSKWYVPDEVRAAQKSLTAIQTEEKAVSELAKRYGSDNVRIVAKQARPPGLPAARQQPQQQGQHRSQQEQ